jgi:hypothetical protein
MPNYQIHAPLILAKQKKLIKISVDNIEHLKAESRLEDH